MQTTVNEGVYTYYQFTAGAIDNSHFITLPDGPSNFKRLQISPNGEIRFFPTTSNGTWESFTFTEVVPSEQVVHITKRNAPGFAIDGNHDAVNTQNVYLWSADPNNVNQQWIEIDRGDGYYSYQKMGTNHCLDGGAPGAVNGQNVYLWNCGEGNNQNQHWQKVDAGGGAFKLIKRNDEGFAINGGSAGENAQNVNLFNSSNNSQNLQWFITPIDVEIKVDGEIDNTIVSFPNPVKSTTTIYGAGGTTLCIYDINGKKLLTKEILTDSAQLDLSSFSQGLYYAKVSGLDSVSTLKILKN